MSLSGDTYLDTILYGVPSNGTRQFFKEKAQYLTNVLSNTGSWLAEKSMQVFNNFYSDQAIAQAQSILRESSNQFRDDYIHRVTENNFRPNLLTQRYLYGCPELWDRYLRGMTSDFGGTYLDLQPYEKDIRFRDEYMDVVDGVLRFKSTGEGYVEHFIRCEEPKNKLSVADKLCMLENWRVVRSLLEQDIDPTDLSN